MSARGLALLLSLSSAPLLAGVARADEAPVKGWGDIFHPTPASQMRDMASDSPFTLDAGHFQVDSSVAALSFDGDGREYWLMPVVLKAGLTNWSDVELALEPMHVVSRPAAPAVQGFGESDLRLLLNVIGNDGGRCAIAIMPWLGLPSMTAGIGRDALEGGLVIPMELALPELVQLSLAIAIDAMRDEDGALAPEVVLIVGATRPIAGDFSLGLSVATTICRHEPLSSDAAASASLAVARDLALEATIETSVTDLGGKVGVAAGFTWRR